ncbi:cadherin-like domain-containing protein [Pseudoalteromonas sp. A601]|uniref:cadherin-like domain-containing protein n=1 Tax=Pseudoalteromonas sp. A601 TaxID=1967839 RepID=UPI001593EE01|nr:cadherin-like domain-containing protein [Pseudoalteromonas sp. A601]
MNNKIKYLPVAIALVLAGCGSSDSNKTPEFTSNTSFSLDEDTILNGQLTAQDSDPVTFSLASSASNGVFQLNADGSFIYTPNENFSGQDTVAVTATDGSLNTNATLTITVNNINDAPTLVNQSITVTTSTSTQGTLTFHDADDDAVTVSIITAPENGVLTLDSSTGEFNYEAESLSEINDSFVVSYTDGNISEAITATILLKPSYITNEDKRNYYYSSESSHLKQAEAIASNINDDAYMNQVNAELASGYLIAGFDDKAEQLFNAVTTLDEQAQAYRNVASKLDSLGQTDEAGEYREKAVTAYNEYIANKGLENISSSDPTFFITIANEYNDAQQYEQAQELYNTLVLYADSVRKEEYDVTYGRFLTAFSRAAASSVESFLADRTEENKQKAKQVIKLFAELVVKTGFQYQSSGEYEGQPVNRLKSFYILTPIDLSLQINDIETAKYYTNYALSLYGSKGLDSAYLFEASPYSEATLATYQYPLETLTAYVSNLYNLEMAANPAFALITKERDQTDAIENTLAYDIANKLVAGYTVADAIAPAKTYFIDEDDNNIASLYTTLAEGYTSPGASTILFNMGYSELGLSLLDEAAKYMYTAEYFDQQASSSLKRKTGWQGCSRHVSLDLQMGSQSQAQTHAIQCIDWMEDNSDKLTTALNLEFYSDAIKIYSIAGLSDDIPALITKLKAEIYLLENTTSKVTALTTYVGYLIENDQPELAQEWVTEAINIVNDNLNSIDMDEFTALYEVLLSNIIGDDELGSYYFTRDSFFVSLAKYQAYNSNYAVIYADIYNKLTTLLDASKTLLLSQSDKVIQDNIETYVELYTRLNLLDTADELINLDVNGAADKLALYTLQATATAAKDDFPGSALASVDTDHDGKPNFFLTGATDEAIAESGLIADTDADNDGVEDSVDSTPLNK